MVGGWGLPAAGSHLGVGREEVQSRDTEPELLRLGELPEAGAQRSEALPGDARRHLQQLLAAGIGNRAGAAPGQRPLPGSPQPALASPQVVDAVAVQAETVGTIGPVHQQLDVLTDAAGTNAVTTHHCLN